MEEKGEFIEIYNNTQNPVDLSNDLIVYHTSAPDRFSQTDSSIVLMPGQYALVLEGDYEFTMGNYQFIVPEEAKVIFLDNNSF